MHIGLCEGGRAYVIEAMTCVKLWRNIEYKLLDWMTNQVSNANF